MDFSKIGSVRRIRRTEIVEATWGSVQEVAARHGITLADALMDVDYVALVDVSSSMASRDSRGGRTRYDVAVEELCKVQNAHPGKVAVIAFSGEAQFCPNGVPPFLQGNTALDDALTFAKQWDGCMRFWIISDGLPDNPNAALRIAAGYESEIDTVYVGPESEDEGAIFLAQLARGKGGKSLHAKNADSLADQIDTLLLTSGR